MWGPQPNVSHHYAPNYQSTPGYISAYYKGAYTQAYNAPLDQYQIDSKGMTPMRSTKICRYSRQTGMYRQHTGLQAIASKHTEV